MNVLITQKLHKVMVTDIKSILEEFHYEPVDGILKLGIVKDAGVIDTEEAQG